DEGDLVIQTTRDPDIHIDAAVEEATRLEAALMTVPEVLSVASRIGSPAVATDIMGLEQADVFVRLKPRDQWRRGLMRERLIEEIDARIASGEPSYTQPIQMRFNELLGGSVSDVTLAIYGEDLAQLRAIGERARDAMARVPGSADVRVYSPPDVPLLEVRPDPFGASQHGLSPEEVLAHVSALRIGVEVGATYDGPVRVPVRVRIDGASDAFNLARAPIPTASGALVELGRVAEVRHVLTPSLVNRDEAQRRVIVGFNVRERDLGSVVADAHAAVEASVELPAGVRLEWGGQYETFERARSRLSIVIPVVLALILAILLALFRSLRSEERR